MLTKIHSFRCCLKVFRDDFVTLPREMGPQIFLERSAFGSEHPEHRPHRDRRGENRITELG